jgi:hypothetical protein
MNHREVDIKVRLENGEVIIVEVQRTQMAHFQERIEYYDNIAYIKELGNVKKKKNDLSSFEADYSALKPVYTIILIQGWNPFSNNKTVTKLAELDMDGGGNPWGKLLKMKVYLNLDMDFGDVGNDLRDWLSMMATGKVAENASSEVKLVKQYYENQHLTGAELDMARTKWQIELDEKAIAEAREEMEKAREEKFQAREEKFQAREEKFQAREEALQSKESALETKESALETKEGELQSRESKLQAKQVEIQSKEEELQAKLEKQEKQEIVAKGIVAKMIKKGLDDTLIKEITNLSDEEIKTLRACTPD